MASKRARGWIIWGVAVGVGLFVLPTRTYADAVTLGRHGYVVGQSFRIARGSGAPVEVIACHFERVWITRCGQQPGSADRANGHDRDARLSATGPVIVAHGKIPVAPASPSHQASPASTARAKAVGTAHGFHGGKACLRLLSQILSPSGDAGAGCHLPRRHGDATSEASEGTGGGDASGDIALLPTDSGISDPDDDAAAEVGAALDGGPIADLDDGLQDDADADETANVAEEEASPTDLPGDAFSGSGSSSGASVGTDSTLLIDCPEAAGSGSSEPQNGDLSSSTDGDPGVVDGEGTPSGSSGGSLPGLDDSPLVDPGGLPGTGTGSKFGSGKGGGSTPTVAPEPASFVFWGLAVGFLAFARRSRRTQ